MRCALLIDAETHKKIFHKTTLEKLSRIVDIRYEPCEKMDAVNTTGLIRGADVAVTSWGSVKLEKEILDAAPGLKLVAHAAGSVKPVVSDEFIRRGIRVTTAAPALGVGVAEFILAAMIMMGKRVKEQALSVDNGGWLAKETAAAQELYGALVGIVGAGFVGRNLIRLLKNFDAAGLWVYDPYLSSKDAESLGVECKSLENIFSACDYICLCAPSTPSTRGMINRELIGMIKNNAVFINYARSALVDEAFLAEELKKGRFCAAIDVTDPEPPPKDYPLRNLPNVLFTPHIAGAIAQNIYRNGEFAYREIKNFVDGKPLVHPVDLSHLDKIA